MSVALERFQQKKKLFGKHGVASSNGFSLVADAASPFDQLTESAPH
jgi:hypothetical protein